MDAQEVKDRLKNVFVHLVKDENEAAQAELHDVLATKMRERVQPAEKVEIAPHDESIDLTVDPDVEEDVVEVPGE